MQITHDFNRRHCANRRKTRVEARIDHDGVQTRAVIFDVSYKGMKLSVPKEIQPGTAVMIHVMDDAIPGVVHWSRMRFAGVHLIDRLDGETLRALETAHDELADYR